MSPLNSSLMFVPFSVQMRSVGYVRDGKTWVPESVKQTRDAERARLVAVKTRLRAIKTILSQDMTDANWFAMVHKEEQRIMNWFTTLTDAEWKAWQTQNIETWITREQRKSGLALWDRITALRAEHVKKNTIPVPSPATKLLVLRREYLENPQSYGFASVEERDAAIAQIEAQIRASQGHWRLDADKVEEEHARVLRVAQTYQHQVEQIQQAWRKMIQRRAIRALAEKFGI